MLIKVFYRGDELSPLELDIERQYIALKYQKMLGYKDKRILKNKTVWTVSDLKITFFRKTLAAQRR